MIITNQLEYDNLIQYITTEQNIILIPIFENTTLHYNKNNLLLTYIGILDLNWNIKKEYIININHYDLEFRINDLEFLQNKNLYVINKKQVLTHIPTSNKIYDINLLSYLFNVNFIELKYSEFVDFNLQTNHKLYYLITPIVLHVKYLQLLSTQLQLILNVYNNELNNKTYILYNEEIIPTLYYIESSGLYINTELFLQQYNSKIKKHLISNEDNILYSEYNLYTSTGRPSNKYGSINFSALSKKDNTREMFISRYKNEGQLIELDYSAYHLTILCNLLDYKFPTINKNMHEYLGKQYFNTDILTTEQYKQTKELNFKYLYGKIPTEYLEIPFFKLVNEFTNQLYLYFLKHGYIISPITKRKLILSKKYNSTKVLNYFLQLLETEITILNIQKLIEFIQEKQINIVLYTYDSILLDIHSSELLYINKMKSILEDNHKYNITIKSGDNYLNIH